MRYLLPLLLAVSCGPAEKESCTKTGCATGTCNPNTGNCVVPSDAGAGGGTGGGGGSAGGGAGGGSNDAGPTSAFVTMKYFYDLCPGTCPEQCVLTDCSAAVVQLATADWNSIRAALPACKVTQKTGANWDIDCRDGGAPGTYTCMDAGSPYIRDTHFTYLPAGTSATACGWTP